MVYPDQIKKIIFFFILHNKMHGRYDLFTVFLPCAISCHIVRFLKHNLTDKMAELKSNHNLPSKGKEIILMFNLKEAFSNRKK